MQSCGPPSDLRAASSPLKSLRTRADFYGVTTEESIMDPARRESVNDPPETRSSDFSCEGCGADLVFM
ncbi:MAG: hypothetical protein CL933_07165 [Deltaproteobacteria bacterium]|nr:hypothetical protein [Deltaproteobacteria bacterium]